MKYDDERFEDDIDAFQHDLVEAYNKHYHRYREVTNDPRKQSMDKPFVHPSCYEIVFLN